MIITPLINTLRRLQVEWLNLQVKVDFRWDWFKEKLLNNKWKYLCLLMVLLTGRFIFCTSLPGMSGSITFHGLTLGFIYLIPLGFVLRLLLPHNWFVLMLPTVEQLVGVFFRTYMSFCGKKTLSTFLFFYRIDTLCFLFDAYFKSSKSKRAGDSYAL